MTTASRHRAGEVAVSAVVLAAGCATRLGEQKVLLPVEGRPMVQRVTDAALGSKAVETIVVVGHEADAVRKALAGRTATVIVNPDYAAGMSTSLQAGVRAVAIGCDAALFLLADQPFVASSLIDQLIERFAETRASVVGGGGGGGAGPPGPVVFLCWHRSLFGSRHQSLFEPAPRRCLGFLLRFLLGFLTQRSELVGYPRIGVSAWFSLTR
jgi:molybdenum cofactor cytidylyltransferase